MSRLRRRATSKASKATEIAEAARAVKATEAAGAAEATDVAGADPQRIVLLGPQKGEPTLPSVLRSLKTDGVSEPGLPLLTITAGWQEREGESDRLGSGVGPTVDLGLYERAERVSRAVPDLAVAHRNVQERLKLLRRAYNRRLAALMTAVQRLESMEGDPGVLDAERVDALADIRRLDSRHLDRVAEFRAEYHATARPDERKEVVRERAEIADLLARGDTVAIAGGHVATLVNRLRWFWLADLLASHTLVAWSAGAMVLGSRVVLFHDRPPWGPGHPEAFENGIGMFGRVLPFPHASQRLALDDSERTRRLARRFAPDVCTLFDPGTRVDRVAGEWRPAEGLLRLESDGRAAPFDSRAA